VKQYLPVLFLAVVLLACAACKRPPLSLNLRLDPSDDVAVGAPVRLDGDVVGSVASISVGSPGAPRTARLVFPDFPPLRVGTVVTGVSATGIEVQAAANAGADPLKPGAWLPRRRASGTEVLKGAVADLAAAKLPWLARFGLDATTLLWVAAAAVGCLWLLRASIVAFFVSSLIAWLVHPLLLPLARKYVDLARANQSAANLPSDFAPGGTAAVLESAVTQALSQMPSPQLLSLGAVFLTSYFLVRALQAARN
jgi:hypothetical protein